MTANPRNLWLSPSLAAGGDGVSPAYEQKFLLALPQAEALAAWVAQRLERDPHATAADGSYLVTSLYLDTPQLDVLRRQPGFRRHKFRVRRYGLGEELHLERKSKRRGQVWKQRTAVARGDWWANLPALTAAAWFHEAVQQRTLQPVCRISYQRQAWMGRSAEGPLRVTIDRTFHAAPADGTVEPATNGAALLEGHAVLECKFLLALPVVLREMVETFRLSPAAVSKYRHGMSACGLAAAGHGGS
jgi:hypothetical protein